MSGIIGKDTAVLGLDSGILKWDWAYRWKCWRNQMPRLGRRGRNPDCQEGLASRGRKAVPTAGLLTGIFLSHTGIFIETLGKTVWSEYLQVPKTWPVLLFFAVSYQTSTKFIKTWAIARSSMPSQSWWPGGNTWSSLPSCEESQRKKWARYCGCQQASLPHTASWQYTLRLWLSHDHQLQAVFLHGCSSVKCWLFAPTFRVGFSGVGGGGVGSCGQAHAEGQRGRAILPAFGSVALARPWF